VPYKCIASSDASLIVAAECRIDNRDELQASLDLAGDPDEFPDEAFVLKAYEKWGRDAFSHLRGDFAVALWDSREETLHLARDQLGSTPLYYFATESAVGFSTCLRALLRDPKRPRGLSEQAILDYMILDFENRESTFYEHVLRLPAGHRLEVSRRGLMKVRYFEFDFPKPLKLADSREYVERFRTLLSKSIRARLRFAGRPGFLLSGGLDSSSVLGAAFFDTPAERRRPLYTFSGLFPDYPEIDEREWIDQIHARGDFIPHFRRMDRESPLGHVEGDLLTHAQPFFSPNNYVDVTLLDDAQAARVGLILDGLDGDTTVGHGWEYLAQLFRSGRWRYLFRLINRLSQSTENSRWFFLKRFALSPTLSGLSAKYFGVRKPPTAGLLNPSHPAYETMRSRLWSNMIERKTDQLLTFREQHKKKIESGMVAASFELAHAQAHVRGMARRHPYWDLELVKFCISLPADQRLAQGADRIIQRRAVAGWSPDSIRHRLSKSVWERNSRDRFLGDDRHLLESMPDKFPSAVYRYVDRERLKLWISQAFEHPARQQHLSEIWSAIVLGMWFTSLNE
jgi:asparagine synthase (glutamine-hydrolysing)